jgi:hypothetical protein
MVDNDRRYFLKGAAIMAGVGLFETFVPGVVSANVISDSKLVHVYAEEVSDLEKTKFVRGRDLDGYLRGLGYDHGLQDKLPGCGYLNWEMATASTYGDRLYLPNAAMSSKIIEYGKIFEDFVGGELVKRGAELSDVCMTNFYRTAQREFGLGKKKPGKHTRADATDFYVKGVPLKDLYDMLDKKWGGGLIMYPNKGFVHMDRRDDKFSKIMP